MLFQTNKKVNLLIGSQSNGDVCYVCTGWYLSNQSGLAVRGPSLILFWATEQNARLGLPRVMVDFSRKTISLCYVHY
jgi:hypothetical protein